MRPHVLVTGGAGYIGAHTCVALLDAGLGVTVVDNFCNSSPEALDRIEALTGRKLNRVTGDIRDKALLIKTLRASGAGAVIHFAGLKAVGESVAAPLSYYDTNVAGTLCLLEAMAQCQVRTLVFSSSATVYGKPVRLPYTEDHPLSPCNPYGRSKLMVEEILRDLSNADPEFRIASLRYFNPVGAHESGLLGDDPHGTPNNLMPFIAQVAAGRREYLNVWGNDYETPDGTGVRDYIHVVDLAQGHLRALEALATRPGGQHLTVNLGSGVGHSVLEMLRTFEQVCGRRIPFRVQARRAGDLPSYHADPTLARQLLGWQTQRDLHSMCADAWRWQSLNPSGYARPLPQQSPSMAPQP